MSTIAHSIYLEAKPGIPWPLERAGSPLENPFVYDAAAKDIKAMAGKGLVEIVDEKATLCLGESLISMISFKRLR